MPEGVVTFMRGGDMSCDEKSDGDSVGKGLIKPGPRSAPTTASVQKSSPFTNTYVFVSMVPQNCTTQLSLAGVVSICAVWNSKDKENTNEDAVQLKEKRKIHK